MNKDIYKAAMDNIQFSHDLDEKVLKYLMLPHQKKRVAIIQSKWVVIATALITCAFFTVFCILLFSNKSKDFELKNSIGNVKVKYVDNVPDSRRQISTDLAWLTEEELFNKWDTSIFKGTVVELRNIEIDFNGSTEYRAVANIKIQKVYRGDENGGQIVSVLLPCPIVTNVWVEDTDVVSAMRVGMTGIFMPVKYDDMSYWEQNGTKLFLKDIAEYGFLDGMRFAFLVTENKGLLFDRHAYPSIAKANSLDEVERYIEQMIDKK